MVRLPCLATFRPAPAATKATAVEMLKVEMPVPPVPQTSITWCGCFSDDRGAAHHPGAGGDLAHRLAAQPHGGDGGGDLGRASARRAGGGEEGLGVGLGRASRRRRAAPAAA